jgi:FkbM family methyltransferase
VKELLARGYAKAFARTNPLAQKVNHTLYHLALRGMGYNNGWQPDRSGEEWFIKNVLPQHGVALDIGANVGEYSKLLLRYTNMTVAAFEPLPDAHDRLQDIEEAYPRRFMAYNVALGRERGTSLIHYGNPTTEHATLSDAAQRIAYVGEGNTKVQQVIVDTVDSIVAGAGFFSHVDFMKIDVEGYEYDVLAGATNVIQTHRPLIQIEWNLHQLMTGHTLLDFLDLVGEENYTVWQMLPHGLRPVDPKRPEANTFCYGNFVFIRNDSLLRRGGSYVGFAK